MIAVATEAQSEGRVARDGKWQRGIIVRSIGEQAEVRCVDILADEGHAGGHVEKAVPGFSRTAHRADDVAVVRIEHRQVITKDGRHPKIAVGIQGQTVGSIDGSAGAEAELRSGQQKRVKAAGVNFEIVVGEFGEQAAIAGDVASVIHVENNNAVLIRVGDEEAVVVEAEDNAVRTQATHGRGKQAVV